MDKQEKLMINFRDLFNKMAWLNNDTMKESLKGFTPSEVHCIESIEKNVDPNVKKLAESLYMTRSAISKLTKKLINKGLIESYQKLENKKEVYFRLTDQGKNVFYIHENVHKNFYERDQVIFEQLTEEQYNGMLTFIENYSKHLDDEIKRQDIYN